MWVFTSDGFYSAVAHRTDANVLVVRARAREDAFALKDWLRSNRGLTLSIEHTPRADYEWRLLVPRLAFGQYLSDRALDIDYPNFKDSVLAKQGVKRAILYGQVWATMLDLQEADA